MNNTQRQQLINRFTQYLDRETVTQICRECGLFPLQLELHNFRINSDGWKKITVNGQRYLENPEGDIWEFVGGEYDEEQLFTWQAAMRETKKAGKRMPTDEEFTELLKTKSDMPNIVLAGHRSTNGSFFNQGTCAYFWSSTESSTDAWFWLLSSSAATVSRSARSQASGFSIRCLKDRIRLFVYLTIPTPFAIANGVFH